MTLAPHEVSGDLGPRPSAIGPRPSAFTPPSSPLPPPAVGTAWLVEAAGCDVAALRDVAALAALFDEVVAELGLQPVAPPVWHRFPEPGGLTGFVVLAESHLSVHTFPEFGSLCLDLFCCRARAEWPFAARLAARLGATEVRVQRVERTYGPAT